MDIDGIIVEIDGLMHRQEESRRFESLGLLKDLLERLGEIEDPFRAGTILRDYLDRLMRL